MVIGSCFGFFNFISLLLLVIVVFLSSLGDSNWEAELRTSGLGEHQMEYWGFWASDD